jgi:hypothetical protein
MQANRESLGTPRPKRATKTRAAEPRNLPHEHHSHLAPPTRACAETQNLGSISAMAFTNNKRVHIREEHGVSRTLRSKPLRHHHQPPLGPPSRRACSDSQEIDGISAMVCTPKTGIMVYSDSGATTSTFGVKARPLFLVPGTLTAETGKFCQTAAGKVPLTHTGAASACLAQNDGTRIFITSPDSTFSINMPSSIALWSEACLVKSGFSIYRGPEGCG